MIHLRSPDGFPFHQLVFQKVPSKKSEIERIFIGSTYNDLMNNSAYSHAAGLIQPMKIRLTNRQMLLKCRYYR